MTMIKGVDISKWQGIDGVHYAMSRVPDMQFIMIKATEGRTYTDPQFKNNAHAARAGGFIMGAYHYARPDVGNSPEEEAANFVSVVKPYIGEIVMALDYEGEAIKYGETWALQWLETVYKLTGVRPMIYLSGSQVKNFKNVAAKNFGLWIAAWMSEAKMKTYMSGWYFWAMWQYSNSGGKLDLDWFNGNREQLIKYAIVDPDWIEEQEEAYVTTCHCGCSCCGKE